MTTRIIANIGGINESNLAKIIEKEGCRTFGNYHYALVARYTTETKPELNSFLFRQGCSVEQWMKDYGIEYDRYIDGKDYAFVSPSLLSMIRDLHSPFLSKKDLRRKGIEPVTLYKVDATKEPDRFALRKIRAYHKIRTKV